MKLRYSPTSPYVRKVTVTLIETGLEDRVERLPTSVWDPETDIATVNPPGQDPGPHHRRRRGAFRLARDLRVPGQPP